MGHLGDCVRLRRREIWCGVVGVSGEVVENGEAAFSYGLHAAFQSSH